MPDDLRRMVEQESSCVACHGTGSAPPIAPRETRTPAAHPSFDPATIERSLGR